MTKPVPPAGQGRNADLVAWGRWIRVLRTARGLTQEELGHSAGIDKNSIGAIERGEKNAGVAYVWPLARALGVRPADMFRMTDTDKDDELHRLLGH